MDIKSYLQSRLENIGKEELLDDEQKMLSLGQLEYFITRRLTSKSFRKNVLKPETKELIRSKVALSIKQNKPIYLIFAFGGYKNHWVADFAPKAEWAEFFHLLYICELITPIAKAYKPGVFLEYESECDATIHHNNTTKAEIDAYTHTFKQMIEFVKPHLLGNIRLNYITLSEQYETEPFFQRVKELVPARAEELRVSLAGKLDEELKRPLFNLKLNGAEDLTHKSQDELNEIALQSLAFNHVFLEEDYEIRKDYFNGEERIAIVGAYCSEEENPDNWLAINSCKRSENAFWTSRGVLQKTDTGYVEDILGPRAYTAIKDQISLEPVDYFGGELAYLDRIPVVGAKK